MPDCTPLPTTRVDGPSPRRRFADFCLALGFQLLLCCGLTQVLTVLWFVNDRTIAPWPLAAAFVLSLGSAFLLVRWRLVTRRQAPLLIGLFLVILGAGLLVATRFYDRSWDGQWYHQEAVVRMDEGWNPIHEFLSEDDHAGLWLNHYPKGPWMAAAGVYRVTGRIESGKVWNFAMAAAAFVLALAAMLRATPLPAFAACFAAALLTANPVGLCQVLTFYVDAQMGYLLMAFLALAALVFAERTVPPLILLAAVTMLACTTKFTGVAYVLVLGAFFLGALAVARKWAALRLAAGALAAGLSLGVCCVGYSPYVRNLLAGKHPSHPVLGLQRLAVVSSQRPPDYVNGNRFTYLARSLFGTPSNSTKEPSLPLRVPFGPISDDSILAFHSAELRVAAWGPLSSEITALTVLGFWVLCVGSGKRLRETWPFLWLLAAVLVSVAINPEAWWARLAPQLWVAPVLVGVALAWGAASVGGRLLGKFLIVVLFANVLVVAGSYWAESASYSLRVREGLANARGLSGPIGVAFTEFPANRARLRDAGIAFHRVRSLPAPPGWRRLPSVVAPPSMIFFLPPEENGASRPLAAPER